MKRFILLLFILATAFTVKAQTSTAAADSIIAYDVTLYDAQFEASVLPQGSVIIDEISWAAENATDSAQIITVYIKQRELVEVAYNNRVLPEGVAADINARLYTKALTLLSVHPWLAEQLMALRADNQRMVNENATKGAAIIQAKIDASNRQQP